MLFFCVLTVQLSSEDLVIKYAEVADWYVWFFHITLLSFGFQSHKDFKKVNIDEAKLPVHVCVSVCLSTAISQKPVKW